MARESDFYLTVDRASGLLTDATCAARAAIARPVPPHLYRRMERAISRLERAQDDLFSVRNDPWELQQPRKPPQLALL